MGQGSEDRGVGALDLAHQHAPARISAVESNIASAGSVSNEDSSLDTSTDDAYYTPLARLESADPMPMVERVEPSARDAKGKGRASSVDELDDSNEGRPQAPRRNLITSAGLLAPAAHEQLQPLLSSKSAPAIASSRPRATTASTHVLRPAPSAPQTTTSTPLRFVSSTSTNLQQVGPDRPDRNEPYGLETDIVEIPRFKRRDLNLGFVKHGSHQRLAWLLLITLWILNALLSLFFDLNVMYILVQCATKANTSGHTDGGWVLASVIYAICWAVSTFGIWLGWELYYEFWMRWRLARPSIEAIYFSLPASLHLSLFSFAHFAFLLHIRLSSLSSPFGADIIPETCYSLVQLGPGLLPQLPRASIAAVVLLTFWPTPSGTGILNGDTHFFRSDNGTLTTYAQAVLLVFTAYVAARLLVVINSSLILLISSNVGDNPRHAREGSLMPNTPMASTSRDVHRTIAPQRSWLTNEMRPYWKWRERSRSRMQDAFELCLMRNIHHSSSNYMLGRANDFASRRHDDSAGGGRLLQAPVDFMPHANQPGRVAPSSLEVLEDEKTHPIPGPSTSAPKESAPLANTKDSPVASTSTPKSGKQSSLREKTSKISLAASSSVSEGLSRARSTSFTFLKNGVNNTAANGEALVRRVRSGTLSGNENGYARVADDAENGEAIKQAPATVPRQRSRLRLQGDQET